MKRWQQNFVIGFIGLVTGIVMVSPVFLQIPIGYVLSVTSAWYLLFFGMFLVGIGLGTLMNTHTIHKLEKKLASLTSSHRRTDD